MQTINLSETCKHFGLTEGNGLSSDERMFVSALAVFGTDRAVSLALGHDWQCGRIIGELWTHQAKMRAQAELTKAIRELKVRILDKQFPEVADPKYVKVVESLNHVGNQKVKVS